MSRRAVNTPIRRIAGIDLRESHEAARQQHGADQQHHREGGFRRQQHIADSRAGAAAEPAGGRAVSTAQRFRQAEAGPAKRRNQPGHHGGNDRHGGRERHHRRIEPDRLEARQPDRRERGRQADQRGGKGQTERPARRRQQQALRQQLPRQPSASGAERGSERQLALTRHSPRQAQIADVDTRDQQHAPHRRREHDQRRLRIASEVSGQRTRAHDRRSALAEEQLRDRRDRHAARRRRAFRFDLRRRRTGRQARDCAQSPRPLAAPRVGRDAFDRIGTPVARAAIGKDEFAAEDTDNRVRFPIHHQRTTDNAGVAGKAGAPQILAEHQHAVVAFFAVLRCEEASLKRPGPERGKQRRRHLRAKQAHIVVVDPNRRLVAAVPAEHVDRARMFEPREVRAIADPAIPAAVFPPGCSSHTRTRRSAAGYGSGRSRMP
jgi:hypothetical protein